MKADIPPDVILVIAKINIIVQEQSEICLVDDEQLLRVTVQTFMIYYFTHKRLPI